MQVAGRNVTKSKIQSSQHRGPNELYAFSLASLGVLQTPLLMLHCKYSTSKLQLGWIRCNCTYSIGMINKWKRSEGLLLLHLAFRIAQKHTHHTYVYSSTYHWSLLSFLLSIAALAEGPYNFVNIWVLYHDFLHCIDYDWIRLVLCTKLKKSGLGSGEKGSPSK